MPSKETLTTATAVAAATLATGLFLRKVKRRQSPKIRCGLKCRCGKVEGYIECIKEDSIRIWCFCDDCREYAEFVCLQCKPPAKSVIGEYGETRVVQVCKSDLHITKGQELMQLSRKCPPSTTEKQPVFMHRYYTKCCAAPLYQTVDFLGFVGVHLGCLDKAAQEQFDGPVAMFPELATKSCPHTPPDIFVPHFLWKLVRYHSSRNQGPFDYDMEPTYWGKDCGGGDESTKDQ